MTMYCDSDDAKAAWKNWMSESINMEHDHLCVLSLAVSNHVEVPQVHNIHIAVDYREMSGGSSDIEIL